MDKIDQSEQKQKLISKVDEEEGKDKQDENTNEDQSQDSEDQEDEDADEDYDPDIRDDILKPASTRSKIVVNLDEPVNPTTNRKRAFRDNDKIEYKLDPYDKVRMRLLEADEKLYKKYKEMIKLIQENKKYQPKKRKVPICFKMIALLIEFFVMLILIYFFFLIVQLSLFNLVILGILIKLLFKIWQFFEAIRWKLEFNYRTKQFNNFIKKQNEEEFKDMKIEVICDREGQWIEFILKEEDEMFEEKIAKRREEIFNQKDEKAIEEMKKILSDYTKEKEEAEKNQNNGQGQSYNQS